MRNGQGDRRTASRRRNLREVVKLPSASGASKPRSLARTSTAGWATLGRAYWKPRGGSPPSRASALSTRPRSRRDRHGRDLPPGARSRCLAGPRARSGDCRPRLLGITKRGNTYLRTLLIHGAEPPCRSRGGSHRRKRQQTPTLVACLEAAAARRSSSAEKVRPHRHHGTNPPAP